MRFAAQRWSLSCLMGCWLLLALAATARGAPVVETVIPGPGKEIWQMAMTPDGSAWFLQDLSDTGNSGTSTMRLGRVAADGTFLGSKDLDGRALFSELVSGPDTSVWVLSSNQSLTRVKADWSTSSFQPPPSPTKLAARWDAITAGPDGRVWLLAAAASNYYADAITPAGDITRYLIGEQQPIPTGVGYHGPRGFGTANGVWFTLPPYSRVVFMTSGGTPSVSDLPGNAALIGAGSGDEAWWLREGSLQAGRVAPGGGLLGQVDLPVTPHMSPLRAEPTAAGTGLLLGQTLDPYSKPPSFDITGRVGIVDSAGLTDFLVPRGFASVPISTGWWSGDCTFAVRLTEAPDGAIWILSTGSPDRLSQWRRGTQDLRTIVLPSAETDQQARIWAWQMTPSGVLWMAENTKSGPRIARLNTLDPPEGLPHYPRSTNTRGSSPRQLPVLNRVALVSQLRAFSRSALSAFATRLRGGTAAATRFRFMNAGTLALKVSVRVKRGHVQAMSRKIYGPRGQTMAFSMGVQNRKTLRRLQVVRRTTARLSVSFRDAATGSLVAVTASRRLR